jgi:hypothetical protein
MNSLGTTGSICAAVISWSINHSILWMVLHMLLGWLYVLYYALGFAH